MGGALVLSALFQAKRPKVNQSTLYSSDAYIPSTVRLIGVSKNTVMTLLLDLADACAAHHDKRRFG